MNIQKISLDGAWDFQIDPDNHPDTTHIHAWRTAIVPMPWQAQFDDLRDTSGTAWYRRRFSVTADLLTPPNLPILHFGAVNYHATVWLNGEPVGEHEGG